MPPDAQPSLRLALVCHLLMVGLLVGLYFVAQPHLGMIYLSGIGLVGLTMAHIYFAIRPEKLWITKGMVFGDITREEFLKHHDPQRWVVEK